MPINTVRSDLAIITVIVAVVIAVVVAGFFIVFLSLRCVLVLDILTVALWPDWFLAYAAISVNSVNLKIWKVTVVIWKEQQKQLF